MFRGRSRFTPSPPPSSFYTTVFLMFAVVPVSKELLIYFSRYPLFIYDQSIQVTPSILKIMLACFFIALHGSGSCLRDPV